MRVIIRRTETDQDLPKRKSPMKTPLNATVIMRRCESDQDWTQMMSLLMKKGEGDNEKV